MRTPPGYTAGGGERRRSVPIGWVMTARLDVGWRERARCAARVVVALACGAVHAQPVPTYAEVAPLFAQRCGVCHSGAQAAASLRLDSHESIMAGGAKGPVVKPGDAANSELIRRVKGQTLPRMPMTGPPWLDSAEVLLLARWVDGGARPGRPGSAAAPPAPGAAPLAGEPVTWFHVAPVFARRCARCHTDGGSMGSAPEGYRLTSHAGALDAADRVRVVPGQPQASELLRRIRGQSLPRMPMDGPPYLSDAEVSLIERWIEQGSRGADGQPASVPAGAKVRLHGTLQPGPRLDALPLVIGPWSRVDKDVSLGRRTQVRGHVDGDGRVVVERLRDR